MADTGKEPPQASTLDDSDAYNETLEQRGSWTSESVGSETNTHRAEPSAGDGIGRFLVLEKLGEGGMGVVVAAYDPVLDRKVAVKLLKPESLGGTAAELSAARLVREAQAMAKISHPNVLPVFDAGQIGGRVFVAMEYVEGETLSQWVRREKRSWQELLGVFVAAGRGLAAAHEAGLVHRDFKPANVLVGEDGRVRVTDFGLVGTAGVLSKALDEERSVAGPSAPRSLSDDTPLAASLTTPGALLGTPLYMAPEQHRRQKADFRTDQFAFCVALFEALFGRKPFEASSYWELAEKVCVGRQPTIPRDTEIPGWIHDVVLRGLRPDPEARFPSMTDLLAELEDDPAVARARRLRIAGLSALFVLLAGLAVFGLLRRPGATQARCRGAEHKLDDVWGAEQRAAVEQAFRGTNRSYAETVHARVESMLDDYLGEWVAAWTDTCEATHVRGEQSESMLDLRMRCLNRRLVEVRALVTLFGEAADPVVLDKAVQATAALGSLEACADADALAAAMPPPADPHARAAVDALGEKLARAKALQDAGKYASGVDLASSLVENAATVAYPPVEAEAWFRLGALQSEAGDARAAEAALLRALPLAASAHESTLVAEIQLWHLWVLHEQAHFDEALRLRPYAEASVALASDDTALRCLMLDIVGALLYSTENYAEARDYFERSLATREQARGRDDPRLAYAVTGLGSTLRAMGRDNEALASNQRALAIRERTLGHDHPEVGKSLQNIGMIYQDKGDLGAAREFYERALAVFERTLGPEHPHVAYPLASIAGVHEKEGDLERALPYRERALAIWEKTLGPEHPQTAVAQFRLARLLWDTHRDRERAVRLAEAARDHLDAAGDKARAEVEDWLRSKRGGVRPSRFRPAP